MREEEEKPKKKMTLDEKRLAKELRTEKERFRLLKKRPVHYHVDVLALKLIVRMSGISQTDISIKTGIQPTYLSGFLTGRYNPNRDELLKLRRLLGFTLKKISAKKIEVLL